MAKVTIKNTTKVIERIVEETVNTKVVNLELTAKEALVLWALTQHVSGEMDGPRKMVTKIGAELSGVLRYSVLTAASANGNGLIAVNSVHEIKLVPEYNFPDNIL